MPIIPGENVGSNKTIANDRFTIVFADLAASDTKTATTSTTTSTESSESTEYSSQSSESGYPTQSMQQILENLEDNRQKEFDFGYSPVWHSMSTTDGSKMKSLDYFQCHKIFQLFTFLISHLLAETPEDPMGFLIALVDRCIRYRDRGYTPPLLFQDKHILSLYTALDPLDHGHIWYDQYSTGMTTLGLTSFNLLPEDMDEYYESVPKNTFIEEAKIALLDQLDNILGLAQPHTRSKHSIGKSLSELGEESEISTYMYGSSSDLTVNKSKASSGSSMGLSLSASKDLGSEKVNKSSNNQ